VARVTVIVLNYNGRELLDIAVPTVLSQTYQDREVVIVDNGSGDGSPEHIAERWPDVRVVALPQNVGVTPALNRGVDATDTELVALLNNDLELDPEWLANSVAALDADPAAAAVAGKMLRFRDRDRFDAAGDALLPSGAALNRGAGQRDTGQFDTPGEVFCACGGAAVYRRAAFAQVGPFDEDLLAYMEDVDWGFRARLMGWRTRYAPAAVAYHMGGATTSKQPARYGRLQRRNHLVVMVKNTPRLARRLPMILLYQLAWFAASARDGMLRVHLGAWKDFATVLPAVLRKRRAIQASRTVSAAEIERALRLDLPAGRGRALLLQVAPVAAGRLLAGR
jgi:GT2 family glycosyltransferase